MKFDLVTNLPRAWGEPIAIAEFKSSPKDFIVRESMEFNFDNEGEHLFLHIRKCHLNTSDVQEILQKQFKCTSVDVGVSGLKDKLGITDQWFSIRTPMSLEDTSLPAALNTGFESGASSAVNSATSKESKPTINIDSAASSVLPHEFVVLDTVRHTRKLRRGAHRHNRFVITLRNLHADSAVGSDNSEEMQTLINDRLESIKQHGFVNYFGPQRFGIDQQNLVKAERYFANPKRKISRVQRGMLISSARSLLFNAVCAKRVTDNTWNKAISGEPMLLDGTHSFFINDASALETDARCRTGDIHPTGPMWGEGEPLAIDECATLEASIVGEYTAFTKGLVAEKLKQQRRALRAMVEELAWTWSAAGDLTLDFNLQKGIYATSFLAELVTLQTTSKV